MFQLSCWPQPCAHSRKNKRFETEIKKHEQRTSYIKSVSSTFWNEKENEKLSESQASSSSGSGSSDVDGGEYMYVGTTAHETNQHDMEKRVRWAQEHVSCQTIRVNCISNSAQIKVSLCSKSATTNCLRRMECRSLNWIVRHRNWAALGIWTGEN